MRRMRQKYNFRSKNYLLNKIENSRHSKESVDLSKLTIEHIMPQNENLSPEWIRDLGENWKDECIVWDCCAGSGNLTREYDFKNLIISTLEQPEVDLLQKQGYTQAFKYDFLNPDDNELFFSDNLHCFSTNLF